MLVLVVSVVVVVLLLLLLMLLLVLWLCWCWFCAYGGIVGVYGGGGFIACAVVVTIDIGSAV